MSSFISVQQQWGEEIYSHARKEREHGGRRIELSMEKLRREKEERMGEARIDPIKYSRS